MRSVFLLGFIASVAFAQTSAPRAATPPDEGGGLGHVELGLSVGYAYGLGRETRDAMMPDLTFGTLPLTVDLGWLLGDHFSLGAYGTWGVMFPNGCPDTVSCSGRWLRVGLRARYRFSEGAGLTPWLSLGAGYERLSETDVFQGTQVSSAVSGFELLRAEVGFEHRVSSLFTLGPFVGGSIGEFRSRELGGSPTDISPRLPHYWLQAGLRGGLWL